LTFPWFKNVFKNEFWWDFTGDGEGGIGWVHWVGSEANKQLVHKPKEETLETLWRYAVHGHGWASPSQHRPLYRRSLHDRCPLSTRTVTHPTINASKCVIPSYNTNQIAWQTIIMFHKRRGNNNICYLEPHEYIMLISLFINIMILP